MNPATLARLPRLFAKMAGTVVVLIGATVLIGWVPSLPSFIKGGVGMGATTALTFVLAGIGLFCGAGWLAISDGSELEQRQAWRKKLMLACGATVSIVGLAKLGEISGVSSFSIEGLWFKNSLEV